MPSIFELAQRHPHRIALRVLPHGQPMSYRQLAESAADAAAWMLAIGLRAGDTIALLCENRSELLALVLGARRIGLYYTPANTHSAPRELQHILASSGARALVVSPALASLAWRAVGERSPELGVFMLPGDTPGGTTREAPGGWSLMRPPCRTAGLDEALAPAPLGRDFLYSSGTTGLPSGIRKPLVPWEERHAEDREVQAWRQAFGFDEHAVYFSAAPLYHAAPLRYAVRVLECGGSCVLMDRFDAQAALSALNEWQVTHSQWVPTMFVRLLALPAQVRARSTPQGMRAAIHAAAPCPPDVKRAMIDWWGPVLHEYYAGSEGIGMTAIDSHEWLAHPGSVGRARVGVVHITDDTGRELPVGEDGQVWFEGGPRFEYFGDPAKTARAYNPQGWATYGDIGHLDAEGYLYLSDRRADLILSGGVNVYPREVEEVLLLHPRVADAAVVGVPDADMGSVPKAFVRLGDGTLPQGVPAEALRTELQAFCRDRLAGIKVPRDIEFRAELPRLESGKLLRRQLREEGGPACRT